MADLCGDDAFMTDEHSELFVRHREVLAKFIDIEGILNQLISCKALTKLDAERIRGKPTRTKQVEELLDIIPLKPDSAFDKVVDALTDAGQQHLVKILGGSREQPTRQSKATADIDAQIEQQREQQQQEQQQLKLQLEEQKLKLQEQEQEQQQRLEKLEKQRLFLEEQEQEHKQRRQRLSEQKLKQQEQEQQHKKQQEQLEMGKKQHQQLMQQMEMDMKKQQTDAMLRMF